MKLNINLSRIKWILFHNNSCYGFECKPTLSVDPNDLYPEDYGAVDLTMIVDDIPDTYTLYKNHAGELTLEPSPIWVPGDNEPVLVKHYEDEDYYKAYSTGELDKFNKLICYVDGSNRWSHTKTESVRYWKKPKESK